MLSLDDIIDKCRCVYGPEGGGLECKGKTELRSAMTAYHFEGELNSPEDPNKSFYCCEAHYEEYEAYWKEMWQEYYSSVM